MRRFKLFLACSALCSIAADDPLPAGAELRLGTIPVSDLLG